MAGSAVAATLLAQRPPEQRQLCIQHRPVANSAACAAASAAQPQHIQLQTCPKQSRAHPPRAAGTLRKQQDAGRGLLQRDQLQWEAPTTPPPPLAQPPLSLSTSPPSLHLSPPSLQLPPSLLPVCPHSPSLVISLSCPPLPLPLACSSFQIGTFSMAKF